VLPHQPGAQPVRVEERGRPVNKRIVLVEDDPQQSASIKAAIGHRYRDAEVKLLETESEFYGFLAALPVGGGGLRMVICDVMLPWAYPEPDAPAAPQKVREGTFRTAGLRCWQKFREQTGLRGIPWIYHTVLDEKAVELENYSDEQTGFIQKSSSIDPLLEEMEDFFHVDDPWAETEEQTARTLVASPRMRRILLEGLITPLADCATSLP
jgi:CheY-like chemotaxis protein